MTLLYPLGLLSLIAVPVLIALSLWRWRRRELVVPSLLLWRDVAAAWRQAPHARRRRRADPLLILRVAVAIALAAALCGPVWLAASRGAHRLAIVLDRSASMAARRPDGPTRWRVARDELLKRLVSLEATDRVEIVAIPPPAGRPTPPELDPRQAASALLALEPSEAPVEPKELVRAAVQALGRRPEARAIVATDAPLEGLPAGVSVLATGAPVRDLGIVAFAARPAQDAATEVLVAVANASDQPASTDVVLFADGREVGRRKAAVPPRGREPVVLDAKLGNSTVLEARLTTADDLAADDFAWLARAAGPLRIAWVGGENYLLRRALAIQSGVELLDLPGPPAGAVPPGTELAVYYRAVPRKLTEGRVVLVAPGAPVGGLRPGPLVEAAEAEAVAPRDPLLAAVRLEGVALGRVPKPVLPAGFETLVAAGGVPVIGRWREGGATLLYVGADPAGSDWPLHPSFPIFWANVVASATGRGLDASRFDCARPGELVPVGEGEATLEEPGGESRAIAGGAFRPDRTGLYRVVRGKEVRAVAVSLLSDGETRAAGAELRPPSDLFSGHEALAGPAIAWGLGVPLTILALAFVLLHGWVAARSGG